MTPRTTPRRPDPPPRPATWWAPIAPTGTRCRAIPRTGQNGEMADSLLERELKFDVEPEVDLAGLDAKVRDGYASETTAERLRSDYYDTSDRALLAANMTLRHRTG